MYEKPQLTSVGDAKTVILGIASLGSDPDGSDFPPEFEFSDDWITNWDSAD